MHIYIYIYIYISRQHVLSHLRMLCDRWVCGSICNVYGEESLVTERMCSASVSMQNEMTCNAHVAMSFV